MTVRFIRVFFLLLSAIAGYYIGLILSGFQPVAGIVGVVVGLLSGAGLIVGEARLKRVSVKNLSVASFGLAFGFFMAWIVTLILRLIPMEETVYLALQIVFTLVFCYLGMVISLKGRDEFNLIIPYVRFSRHDEKRQFYILDTSVIIDGRIEGIIRAGFLSGKMLVPRFVLNELHSIADSSDETKRTRGRKGLDMLEKIRECPGANVIVHEEMFPGIREVDAKLVRLAKMLDCQIITNDVNLSKVACLESVGVLNINELASALRPVVYPGELMEVYIRKEGKEKNQGVAFLDDGTMVVVDNAGKLIGKKVSISVTSTLQTSAGKMVFGNLANGKTGGE